MAGSRHKEGVLGQAGTDATVVSGLAAAWGSIGVGGGGAGEAGGLRQRALFVREEGRVPVADSAAGVIPYAAGASG